jgi:hypothetical protein
MGKNKMWDETTIKRGWEALIGRWRSLGGVKQLYLAGLVGTVGGLASEIVWPKNVVGSWILVIGLLFASFGLILECYGWVSSRKDHWLATMVITIAGVFALGLAAGAGCMAVAQATGQSAAHFQTAVKVVAPFAFILFLAVAIAIASLVGILLLLFSAALTNSSPRKTFARCLGLIGLSMCAIYVLMPGSVFDKALRWSAAYSAFEFDMYPDPACSPVLGDRVARINDSIVIVGRITDDGLRFVRRACVLAPEITALPPPRIVKAQTPKAKAQRP